MSDVDDLIASSTFCSLVHRTGQLTREVAPQLEQVGTTPREYFVLGVVLTAPGCTPAELARRCDLTPQHMAHILDRLERAGHVVREGERGRGRTTLVRLTEDGGKVLQAGWPAVHATGSSRLTEGQETVFRHLLARLAPTDSDATGANAANTQDVVVLVDDAGEQIGTAPRATVHDTDTPLHRAFSTYLRDSDGRVLLTRRALHKATWPGVWTNAACGHVRPGEDERAAAERRVPEELGTAPSDLRVVLPDFRYRATDASGIVENECCPVMVGEIDPAALDPDPEEVAEHAWVAWEDVRMLAERTPWAVSPWMVDQVRDLGERPWGA